MLVIATIATISLLVCALLWWQMMILGDQVRALGGSLREVGESYDKLALTMPAELLRPMLENRRIALCIEQDHKLPVLETLIRERLEAEDAQVLDMEPAQADELMATTKWRVDDFHPDVLVRGKIQCNQYREVYYHADLTFVFASGVVSSILENPPNGARQANLAIAVVQKIKQTLEQAGKKAERTTALSELNG